MNSSELRYLRFIALITVGIAAFQAVSGRWASAGALLVLLIVFSLFVIWRSRRFGDPQTPPKENETRTRRLIARVLPVMLVFFAAVAVYEAVDGDWSGAAWFGFCLGVGLIGLFLNHRWLAEKA